MRAIRLKRYGPGRTDVEYALIFGSVVMLAIAALFTLGQSAGNSVGKAVSPLNSGSAYISTLDNFESLTMAFYDANHAWPRPWGNYRFTDLGLNPATYAGPVDGVIWNPNGSEIGMNSTSMMYVNDFNGNLQAVSPEQNVWCQAATGACTLGSGLAVDISTLRTTE
jgi:hypothetical protein